MENLTAVAPAAQVASAANSNLLAPVPAPAPAGAPFATLIGATEGVKIIRGGQDLPVTADTQLRLGDRVLVPEAGQARISVAGPHPAEAPVSATLTGGSDVTFAGKPLGNGLQEIAVDVAAGDLVVDAPLAAVDASQLLVKKTSITGGGSMLDGGALWPLLGLLGLAGLAGSSGGGDSATVSPPISPPVSPPEPTPAPPAPTPAPPATDDAVPLLNPAQVLLEVLPGDSAGSALGPVIQGLTPVLGLVSNVADVLNDVTAPLLGADFHPADTGPLDPVDDLAGTLLQDLLAPLLDPLLTPLLGANQAENLARYLGHQVDFVTDGVENLLGLAATRAAGDHGGLLDGLLGNGSVATHGGGLLGGDLLGGLLGGISSQSAPAALSSKAVVADSHSAPTAVLKDVWTL